MEKLDLSKRYKSYYRARTKPEVVMLEAVRYLSITGKGDPASELYAQKLQALYTTAYGIKFICKALGQDFTVAKLEGIWWYDEAKYGSPLMDEAPLLIPRSEWHWRLLIRLPEFVNEAMLAEALQKKEPAFKDELTFFVLPPQKVVQMMHIGPFSEEPATLKLMLAFIREHDLQRAGLHQEVYLSDFRRTDPAKLKTILREPVQ